MTAGALAAAWCGLVLVGAARRRPRRSRVDSLMPAAPQRTRRSIVALTGAALLTAIGRRGAATDAAYAGRVGRAALAGVLPLVPLGLGRGGVVGGLAAVALYWLPVIDARRAARRRQLRIEAQLPEVVDLLLLAVGAGLTVALALDAVARRASGELAEELAVVVAASRQGRRLADALEDLPARAGEGTRPMVAALVASERYGAPLAAGLGRLAGEVRAIRRRRAEEAARKVPVKLLFPLVVCILPAFALLTVAPLIASALRSLRL